MMSQKKNVVAQRISSARVYKVKELKNEIFDLQQKLEASSVENHILKEIQCHHSNAVRSYENPESNLLDLLACHSNEATALRKHLRTSQKNERNTSRKLREVEAELQSAKDALQNLRMLSEDKTLAEREELHHRLSVLAEQMEVNAGRIQSLEKQLKLNNSTLSHQLANENKKAVEAGIITKNLQMEINSLHQKIKEKDRQLNVKNIYANRMFKVPKDESDSAPHEKKRLWEDTLLMEECTGLKFMEEGKKTDLLKQELKNLVRNGQTPLRDSVKENHQEEDAVEKYEKEGKSPDEQLHNREKAGTKCATLDPRDKISIRVKTKYTFLEATENLHHRLFTLCPKSRKGSLCNYRHAAQDCSKTADSRVKISFGLYEPSFGKVTKARQEDSSTEMEGCTRTAFAERSLTKEFFGSGCA